MPNKIAFFLSTLLILINKYKIKFTGILHVGAHECEEIIFYDNVLPRNKVLWIDALPDKVELSKAKFQNILIENAVVSDKIENVSFNISNNGQSSSFLQLGTHLKHHPYVFYILFQSPVAYCRRNHKSCRFPASYF